MYIFLLIEFLFFILTYSSSLETQLQNTKQLIELYQEKLQILESMKKKNPNRFQKFNSNSTISLGHTPQMQLYPINWHVSDIVQFIPPFFFVKNSTIHTMKQEDLNIHIKGRIIAIDHHEITSFTAEGIQLTKFRQQTTQKMLKIFPISKFIAKQKIKWHKASHFQDRLIQWNQNILYLFEENYRKQFLFKSEILNIFSLNQYKVVYVTRYQYGVLNVRTYEILSEHYFGSIARTAIRSNNGFLFVLFKNNTINVIVHQKIVYSQNLEPQRLSEQTEMSYISQHLFIFSRKNRCFEIFETNIQALQLRHVKRICLPLKFNNNSTEFSFNFFVLDNSFRLLATIDNPIQKIRESYQYQLFIQIKQPVKQSQIPWKMFTIVIAIIIIVYYRSKTNKKQQTQMNHKKKDVKYDEIETYLARQRQKDKLKKKHPE